MAGAGAGEAGGEVGRLVESSQAEDRRVIRLVRERPVLYARTNMPVASYYSSVRALWREVADEMGWTVAEVRRKWSHIRNSYSRHLRNEMYGVRTGRGRAVSRWYLADELHFLRDHMATDTRGAGSAAAAAAATQAEAVDVKPPASLLAAGGAWAAALAAGGARVKREPAHSDDSSCSQGAAGVGAGVAAAAAADESSSSYFQFFRAIHSDYRALAARKRRLFKRQCLHLLHELLDEDDAAPATLYQDYAINLSSSAHDSDDASAGAPAAAAAAAAVAPGVRIEDAFSIFS